MTDIDLSEFRTPGRGKGLLDVFRWRYLLRLLVRKGTQTRYRGSVLGWVWSYVKPAAQFVMFYIVMGVFLRFGAEIPNFAVYLFSGIVLVNFFSEGFGNATRSIVDNEALVKKIYLPRELFPIAAVIVSFTHFLPQLAILLIASIALGWTPSLLGIAAILVGTFLIAAVSIGFGMAFGALNVAFRDAQNFVELILMFATWAAPVLYSWDFVARVLPSWLFHLYLANPLSAAVELFHIGFWLPTTSDSPLQPPSELWTVLPYSVAFAVLSLVLGQLVFRHFERRFAQEL